MNTQNHNSTRFIPVHLNPPTPPRTGSREQQARGLARELARQHRHGRRYLTGVLASPPPWMRS